MEIRNPKTKLQTALDILDQYTDAQSIEPMILSIRPQTSGMGIHRILKFTHQIIKGHLTKKFNPEKIAPVAKALDDVKRYHPIISQSLHPEDKKLSKRAIDSIHRYNRLFSKNTKKPWYRQLFVSILNKNRPPLLNSTSVHQPEHPAACAPALRAASAVQEALLKQEEDAFRMKAISLIQKQGILFPSIQSALQTIRNAPIFISSKSHQASSSVITLNQILSPFPGETVVLTGSFKRTPGTQTPTTPLSKSFALKTSNTHTGHPFPSQHNGWALPDPMFPAKPYDSEAIPILKALIEKKESIQESLRRQTPLKRHAQELILQKQKAAENNIEEFIKLHTSLSFALLSAAPPSLVRPDSPSHVLNFFTWVKKQPSPYHALSACWDKYNKFFLIPPAQNLFESWLKQTEKDLFKSDPALAFNGAKKVLSQPSSDSLEQSFDSIEAGRFFSTMHGILESSAQNIYLQYFSEMIEYSPPVLNGFEKKLQSLVFSQFQDYISELDSMPPEIPFEKMRLSLEYEAEFMSQQESYHPLVGKLEHYFAKRTPPAIC